MVRGYDHTADHKYSTFAHPKLCGDGSLGDVVSVEGRCVVFYVIRFVFFPGRKLNQSMMKLFLLFLEESY